MVGKVKVSFVLNEHDILMRAIGFDQNMSNG